MRCVVRGVLFCFFFNDTATTEIYTLSLHDALPISSRVLNDFRKKGIAECINPKEKTGRLYVLKPVGKTIRDRLRESH